MADSVKKRIGVHVGTAGGCWTAVERAVAAGANTFQMFSASPRHVEGVAGEAGGRGEDAGAAGEA